MSELHPSHRTRFSFDASSFDEICEQCGRTDEVPGGWGQLALPCPKSSAVDKLAELTREEVRSAEDQEA